MEDKGFMSQNLIMPNRQSTYFNSSFIIKISGIRIESDLVLQNYIHAEYIKNLKLILVTEDILEISGNIVGEDIYKNYITALEFRDFIQRLFSMFSTRIKIESFSIEPKPGICTAEIAIPTVPANNALINNQAAKILKEYQDKEVLNTLDHLVESQQKLSETNEFNFIHKYRTLFAIFDSLSPKNSYGHIDYRNANLLKLFTFTIKENYGNFLLPRFIRIREELVKAGLKYIYPNETINHSDKLAEAIIGLSEGEFINDNVSFHMMKCLQLIRNSLNHGDFSLNDCSIVSWAFEIHLHIVKALINSKIDNI